MDSDNRSELNYWPSFVDIFASLFFIFLILFAIYYTSVRKTSEAVQKDIDDLKAITNSLDLVWDNASHRLEIPESLLFDFGKHDIKEQGNTFAKKLGKSLDDYMSKNDRHTRYTIVIEGHTDTMGSPEYNYDLSLKRSLSVIDAITKYSNMPKGKEIELIPAAYGESRLKIKTVQEKRCEDNRRVGIRIMPIFIDTSKKVLK